MSKKDHHSFLSTSGHHHGRPGSRWVHEHRDTVLAKTALVLSCERFAQTDAYQVSQDQRDQVFLLRSSSGSAERRRIDSVRDSSARICSVTFTSVPIDGSRQSLTWGVRDHGDA